MPGEIPFLNAAPEGWPDRQGVEFASGLKTGGAIDRRAGRLLTRGICRGQLAGYDVEEDRRGEFIPGLVQIKDEPWRKRTFHGAGARRRGESKR